MKIEVWDKSKAMPVLSLGLLQDGARVEVCAVSEHGTHRGFLRVTEQGIYRFTRSQGATSHGLPCDSYGRVAFHPDDLAAQMESELASLRAEVAALKVSAPACPFEEGSGKWAVWQMLHGKKVGHDERPMCSPFRINGHGVIVDSSGGGYSWDSKFPTGWRIREDGE